MQRTFTAWMALPKRPEIQRHFPSSKIKVMKVPSTILHAMLITAALGGTATGCQTLKPQAGDNKEFRILPANSGGIIGKIKDIFRPAPTPSPGYCGLCGMG